MISIDLFSNVIYKNDLKVTVSNVSNIDNLKNQSILITGASGLIGSAIVDTLIYANLELNYNIKIYAAGRNKKRMYNRFDKNEIIFIPYDATKKLDFEEKVDYIIHAASNAHPHAYSEEPVETMLANFNGMHELLEYARNNNVKRTLYVSTSEIYGQKENNLPYKEDEYGYVNILNARSCYPSSKRASETLCVSYKQEYDIEVVIARPGHIYGPTMTARDTRVSALFARNVINQEDIVMKSAGTQIRSYTYVFDNASAILTILLNGANGDAYNISNPNSIVTIRELAETFANINGKEVKFENPSDVELKSFNMMENSSLDSTKLENLGWQGLYNIQKGVETTIKILKGNI